MKPNQKGEVTVFVIVMVAMMAWMMSEGMGMMGMWHNSGNAEKSGATAQPLKIDPAASTVPSASPEYPH